MRCVAAILAAALAVPLPGQLIRIFPSGSYQSSNNYGRAYDATISAGQIALGPDGTLYFAESLGFNRGAVVRAVTPDWRIVPIAGYGVSSYIPPGHRVPALLHLDNVYGLTPDKNGNLFIGGLEDGIFRMGADGLLGYLVMQPDRTYTQALATDSSGTLYALEAPYYSFGTQVVKVLPDGTFVPWAGTGTAGYGGDGGPATSAQINAMYIVADAAGNLFIADSVNGLIRKVNTQGTIDKVAQGGGPIALDARGNLYYFSSSSLNRLSPGGQIDAIATIPNAIGMATDAAGNIFVSSGGRLYELDASGTRRLIAGCACYGDGVPATWATSVNVTGLVRDGAGNVYLSDSGNNTVRRIAPDGTISLVAGTGDAGFSGDGGPARQARLSAPSGLAFDTHGNLYIADRGNSAIRKVSPDGNIQTVAGNGSAGFSGDGGPAISARLGSPDGVAVDSSGNVYIADTANHRIRKVTTDGTIQTIAGSDNYGTSGDGGPASQALLVNPRALAFDADGNLIVTDSSAHMARRITPAGIMQRVSGTGVAGNGGDGGPAIAAQEWAPWGLAVDAAGNIYIGDTGTYLIRVVDRSGVIQTVRGPSYYAPATGLATDPGGNLWIAGGSLGIFTQGGSPIPLAPVIADRGVANAASGQAVVVAPGEMVTISGNFLGPATPVSGAIDARLSTVLAGVQVLFDDVPAPLLQVRATQITAVVPFEVAGKSTVAVRVEYNGVTSNTATVGVLAAVPGIFNMYGTALALGTGAPGSIVSVFVTGAGAGAPLTAYLTNGFGTPGPAVPVEVTYAGPASWLPAGTIQVNVRLPGTLEQCNGGCAIGVAVGDSPSPLVRIPQ
jgi:uncharacterized protein (TIGR03437 family)